MKTLLLLFLLATSCSSSQGVSKRILARGIIYDWKITEMTDGKEVVIYFTLNSAKNGLYVGIVEVEELKYFIEQLRLFASYTDNIYDRYERSDSFAIGLTAATSKITLTDYKDSFLILTKSNAKALATDIEKSINLMNK